MRGVSKRKANPLIDSRAVRIAREALDEVGEGGVGKHIGVAGMGRNVATHRFEAEMPGYPGWEWQAVLACAEGSRYVTVNEVALVPGGEALQPPEWVPYEDRVRPGDLGPGDLMPPAVDDSRLDGDKLSKSGLDDAKKRWRTERGPNTDMAAKARLQCRTCAFYVQLLTTMASAPMSTRRTVGWCTRAMAAVHIRRRACGKKRPRRWLSMMKSPSSRILKSRIKAAHLWRKTRCT